MIGGERIQVGLPRAGQLMVDIGPCPGPPVGYIPRGGHPPARSLPGGDKLVLCSG